MLKLYIKKRKQYTTKPVMKQVLTMLRSDLEAYAKERRLVFN